MYSYQENAKLKFKEKQLKVYDNIIEIIINNPITNNAESMNLREFLTLIFMTYQYSNMVNGKEYLIQESDKTKLKILYTNDGYINIEIIFYSALDNLQL